MFVLAKFFQTTWLSRKLAKRFLGPFTITGRPSSHSFQVKLPDHLCFIHLVVIAESWWLRDHLRWVFRKNSMEFSVGFGYLLIHFYKWLCLYFTQSHILPEHSMITWPCHVIWFPNLPCYLYLDPIIRLDVRDQMFECMGNFFFSGALITLVFYVERVQKGIAYWDKQNNNVPAPNCVLKVWEKIIKDEGL